MVTAVPHDRHNAILLLVGQLINRDSELVALFICHSLIALLERHECAELVLGDGPIHGPLRLHRCLVRLWLLVLARRLAVLLLVRLELPFTHELFFDGALLVSLPLVVLGLLGSKLVMLLDLLDLVVANWQERRAWTLLIHAALAT